MYIALRHNYPMTRRFQLLFADLPDRSTINQKTYARGRSVSFASVSRLTLSVLVTAPLCKSLSKQFQIFGALFCIRLSGMPPLMRPSRSYLTMISRKSHQELQDSRGKVNSFLEKAQLCSVLVFVAMHCFGFAGCVSNGAKASNTDLSLRNPNTSTRAEGLDRRM